MLVIIAPYSLEHRSHNFSLGATRKIDFFLSLLARLEHKIVLVNTLHAEEVWHKREEHTCRIGGTAVREIVLRQYPVRSVGKLLNLCEVGAVAKEIAKDGEPTLIWVYNAYVFEVMLARALKQRFIVPLVFQFEDWAMSRRKWHPKSLTDLLSWRYLLPEPDLCLAANRSLLKRERRRSGCDAHLCPGVVPAALIDACIRQPAFSDSRRHQIVVGYFGTLSIEKGAEWMLDIVEHSGDDFIFHVSGKGPLAGEFEKLSARRHRLFYHGLVDEQTVYDLMANCDVLLNPHKPIEVMGDGVFPFKVIEYVASGRLVISTPLPDANLASAFKSVVFVKHDKALIMSVLHAARQIYELRRAQIETAVTDVRQRFGEQGLMQTLRDVLAASRNVETYEIEADAPELLDKQLFS